MWCTVYTYDNTFICQKLCSGERYCEGFRQMVGDYAIYTYRQYDFAFKQLLTK